MSALVKISCGLHAEPWDKYISVYADDGKVAGILGRPAWRCRLFGMQTVIDASRSFCARGVAKAASSPFWHHFHGYLVNDYWALELKPKYAFVNYADPASGNQWENLETAEVSEADKNHPAT